MIELFLSSVKEIETEVQFNAYRHLSAALILHKLYVSMGANLDEIGTMFSVKLLVLIV